MGLVQLGKELDVRYFFDAHSRGLALGSDKAAKQKSSGKEKNSDNEMPFGAHHSNMIQIDVRWLASL